MSCQCVTYFPGTQPIVGPDSPSILVNLMAYWKMEEGGATNREDAHTGNYDLSSTGASAPAALIGNGSLLTGSSGHYLNNSSANFGVTGAMTIAGWARHVSISLGTSGVYIVGKTDWTTFLAPPDFPTAGYMIRINPSSRYAFWRGNGATSSEVVASGFAVSYNEWHFIVAGFDGTDSFIQINNGERFSATGLVSSVGVGDFKFGEAKGVGGATPMSGPDAVFDEWGFWFNRALSLADVSYLYNSGSGRTYPFT